MAYGTANVDVIQSSTAGTPPQFNDGNGTQTGTLCRAWVNWNGASGASPTVQASFNVSSLTRTGTGLYTISFTNALADANYAVTGTAQRPSANSAAHVSPQQGTTPTTTTLYVATYEDSAAQIDVNRGYVAIFR